MADTVAGDAPDQGLLKFLRGIGEELNRNETETGPSTSKFQTCQLVKIRIPKEGENPGLPAPVKNALGKSGVVEMEGKVYIVEPDKEGRFEQAYFVRIDGIGPVLASEGWIEDAEDL